MVRHTYNSGISLISIPFDYSADSTTQQGNACLVFGLDTTSPPKSVFDFLTWVVGSYYAYDSRFPEMPAGRSKVAQGYFLYSAEVPLSVYATDAVVGREVLKDPQGQPFEIDLFAGWNMIGDPFHGGNTTHSVSWYGDAVRVLRGDGAVLSVRDAIAARVIKAGLWSYVGGRYELSYTVDEWKGYWVKAYEACRLLISRREASRSRADGGVPGLTGRSVNWSQRLVARAGASASDAIDLGVAADATDGCDPLRDIEKPPAMAAVPYVYLSFPHPDWNENAGAYGVDVRSATGRKTWEFTAASNVRDADIVLTWPKIGDLPKDVSLTLVDEETGVRRSMRTSSGYQFRMASGTAVRRFRVEAGVAAQGVLRVSGLTAGPGRGGSRTITCSLSSGGSVDVTVTPAAGGRPVRRIARGLTRAAGLAQFVWDGRDEGGARVPSGVYLCEVRATGEDGQVAKAVTVLTVAR